MIVENEQDLGEAIDRGEETIEVKGKLAPRIKKIWFMDRFLWCLCLACLAVAIAALVAVPATGMMSAAVSLVSGTPAALLMGTPAAVTAVLTAAAGGGIATLKKLRNCYKLESAGAGCVVLHKKYKSMKKESRINCGRKEEF
ncbi:hypothetical protein CBFG_02927 [Clostridiales bacterium 1_7_47FAA]|uniref:Uncharacterized protein n=1 Tax=Enterocloster hominis (ex Hitch et al. 2024) TaxID=1917870 RepID=A0ABV1D5V8_9FIRM|nr:hypothetical protein CBFG_02927 [Clostridiales bacterium 1_7_47FAA]